MTHEAPQRASEYPRAHLLPCLIAAVMLLIALEPSNPSDYYMLLRWVVSPVAIFLAYRAWTRRTPGWGVPPIIIAALFNPVLPIWSTRDFWAPVDMLSAVTMAFYAFIQLPAEEPPPSPVSTPTAADHSHPVPPDRRVASVLTRPDQQTWHPPSPVNPVLFKHIESWASAEGAKLSNSGWIPGQPLPQRAVDAIGRAIENDLGVPAYQDVWVPERRVPRRPFLGRALLWIVGTFFGLSVAGGILLGLMAGAELIRLQNGNLPYEYQVLFVMLWIVLSTILVLSDRNLRVPAHTRWRANPDFQPLMQRLCASAVRAALTEHGQRQMNRTDESGLTS